MNGTFKRFKYTKCALYSFYVTDEQYLKMLNEIRKIESKKDEYKFNFIGIVLVSIHKKIKRDKAFYCAEFVKYILQCAGVAKCLPDIIKPEDFKMIDGIKLEYEGLLRNYPMRKLNIKKRLANYKVLIYNKDIK